MSISEIKWTNIKIVLRKASW